jgi:hypothetical protein
MTTRKASAKAKATAKAKAKARTAGLSTTHSQKRERSGRDDRDVRQQ